jgi:hypothetical protein
MLGFERLLFIKLILLDDASIIVMRHIIAISSENDRYNE